MSLKAFVTQFKMETGRPRWHKYPMTINMEHMLWFNVTYIPESRAS